MNKAMLLKQYMFNNKKKGGRLPSAYQEVEYIESTGTQYIDTNIKVSALSSAISMSYRFMPTNTLSTNESAYLGTYGTYPNYFMQLTTRSNISNVDLFIGNPEQGGEVHFTRGNWTNYEQTLQINITGSSGSAILNSNTQSFNYTAPTISGALYLFALNNNGTPKINSAMRLYEFKFKNNGTLIRNFIPCYRKSDNEIGLYDLVNNQFYTNQGTGSFLCGRPLVNIDGYEQLDYIESSGTQYIDTGYNINDNKVKIKIKFRITDWNESGFYFGCGYVGGSNAFTASTNYLGIGATSINAFSNQNSMVGVINELEMEANESTKKYSYSINNGTSVAGSYSGTIKSNLSMPIFKGTIYSSCCDCRVYSFRLYANDILQRDFIPCYRKSDNEVGLYDIVNNQFYTNQGSGSFVAGEVLKA